MYTQLNDFIAEWKQETELTARVFHRLTDESLEQPVADGFRTLGRIAWHIVCSLQETLSLTGLSFEAPNAESTVPRSAAVLSSAYEAASYAMLQAMHEQWEDSVLRETRDFFGTPKTVEAALDGLVHHEIHHRGQLLILMRQAGLTVPDVYGPTLEMWGGYGMQPPQV